MSSVRLSAAREEDYTGSLLRYFEESEDVREQLGFILPPSTDDLKFLLPLAGTYKLVSSSGNTDRVRGIMRVGTRIGKTTPKVHVRFFVDNPKLIEEVFPLVKSFAKAERKLIVVAYKVFGYEKEKIDTLLSLGFGQGATTSNTSSLEGKRYNTLYLYEDIEKEYDDSPRRDYAENGDLYPVLPVEKQKRPSRLDFRMASPEDGTDLSESMSHQNTLRTFGMGMYSGFLTKGDSAGFIEQGRKSGFDFAIVCVDGDRGKAIGLANLGVSREQVSRHVGDIGIHVNAKYHGLGIGTELMKEVELLAKRLHLESLVLSYFDNNEAGKRLYERMGYEHRGEVPGWLSSRYVNEVFMQKML